jgi:hypothetical protein
MIQADTAGLPKSLAEFAPSGAKKLKFVFSRRHVRREKHLSAFFLCDLFACGRQGVRCKKAAKKLEKVAPPSFSTPKERREDFEKSDRIDP